MAKRRRAGSNKSQAIRSYKESHSDAGPKEVAAALGEQGIKVTPQFVSTVLSNDRRKGRNGRRKGRRGRGPIARGAGGNMLDHLVAVRKLADSLGGIDQARAALDALARILG